jgi:lipopolysaccharide/colanic/teichoic acid biosynthesis glycosyltransferase
MLEPRVTANAKIDLPVARTDGGYFFFKRAFDVIASWLALGLLSPLFVVVAVAIKLDSRGPVLFRQERIGARRLRERDGTRWEPVAFVFYKFRTMHNGSSSDLHEEYIAAYIDGDTSRMAEAAGSAAGDQTYKLVNDPRVTSVGRVLRKLSIDELPQLWNVARGDMSLVGPRPAIAYEVAMYKERHHRRLAAQPGITGLWQVSGRSHIGFEEMVDLDCEYIEKRSLLYDLKLLCRTIPVVLSTKGAG